MVGNVAEFQFLYNNPENEDIRNGDQGMLKRLFFAIFLFASCDLVWSQVPPKTPQVEPEQQPEGGLKTQDGSTQQPNTSTQPPPSIPEVKSDGADRKRESKTEEGSEQGTEFWPPFRGYRLKVTDTLLAGITFLLFLAILALWWSTRKLVRGAEKTAERQLRAYVSITQVKIIRMRRSIAVEFTNSGQTPWCRSQSMLKLA
jgi:hypothetical protein